MKNECDKQAVKYIGCLAKEGFMKSFGHRVLATIVILLVLALAGFTAGRLEQQKKLAAEEQIRLEQEALEREQAEKEREKREAEELRKAKEEEERRLAELREAEEAAKALAEKYPLCERVYDFDVLKEMNEDIYACIQVPGTKVDYPIVQTEKDNYYLKHNLDHSEGLPGAIYTNMCNSADFSDANTVIYGHNMKNKSMFGDLHSFEKEEFFAENREIRIYTETQRLTYEIIIAAVYDDTYLTVKYDSKSGKDMLAFADSVLAFKDSRKHVVEDLELTADDKLVTLSTCVGGENTRRYFVIGRLSDVAYYEIPEVAE